MTRTNYTIEVNHLSKRFHLWHGKEPSLKTTVVNLLRGGLRKEEFWALRQINFKVKRGETLGIIGPNGSGKTTLLRILAGIIYPTSGEIKVGGRVSTLFELGTGFHPDLTGRENIFLNGAILGLGRQELREKFDQIIEFSGLGKFMEMPLKHYSSGMQVRLAFSIAVNVNPEILLIDEVLAVGDAAFQEKSYSVFEKFKKERVTIVFVSHDLAKIEEFCDRVLYIDHAKLVASGDPHSTIKKYLYYSSRQERPTEKRKMVGMIEEIKCFDSQGKEKTTFQTGEDLLLKIKLNKPAREIYPLNLGFAILDKNKAYVYGVNTFLDQIEVPIGTTKIKVLLKKLPLFAGQYYLAVTPCGKTEYEVLDYQEVALSLQSISKKGIGVTFIDHDWDFGTED